jgi:predicted nucleic acid-binding protein
MRIAVDTNVLAYAERLNGEEKGQRAIDLIGRLPPGETVIPVQVLGELFNVLCRKAQIPAPRARATILDWSDLFEVIETTQDALAKAMDIVADHHFSIWDAVILSTASSAGCRVLLSEDMHHGFTWGGVTTVNPFAQMPHPLLAGLLKI